MPGLVPGIHAGQPRNASRGDGTFASYPHICLASSREWPRQARPWRGV